MGYDVHIARKMTSWTDENDDATILLAGWKAPVAHNYEMRLDNRVEAS